jgi:hypothetical protein
VSIFSGQDQSFDFNFEDPKSGACHPEGEVEILCRFLSLILDARVNIGSARINYIDLPDVNQIAKYKQFIGEGDFSSIDKDLRLLLSMDHEIARQFTRSCKCYSFAVIFHKHDPRFSPIMIHNSHET